MRYKIVLAMTGSSSCSSEIDFDGNFIQLRNRIFKKKLYTIMARNPLVDPHLVIQTKNIASIAITENYNE